MDPPKLNLIGPAHTNRGSGFYFLGAVLVRSEFAVIYNTFCTSGRPRRSRSATPKLNLIGPAHTNRGSGFYFLGAVLVRSEFAVIYNTFCTSGRFPGHPWLTWSLLWRVAPDPPKRAPTQPRPQNAKFQDISSKSFILVLTSGFFWNSASSLFTPFLCSRLFFLYASSFFTRLLRLRVFFLISGPQPSYLYRFKP